MKYVEKLCMSYKVIQKANKELVEDLGHIWKYDDIVDCIPAHHNLNIFTNFRDFLEYPRKIRGMPEKTCSELDYNPLKERVVVLLEIIGIRNKPDKLIQSTCYPQYLLLLSLAEYLYYEAPPEEVNMYMIVELLNAVGESETEGSNLDRLYDLHRKNFKGSDKVSLALVHYDKYKKYAKYHKCELARELRIKMFPIFCTIDNIFEAAKSDNPEIVASTHWRSFQDNFPDLFSDNSGELSYAKKLFSRILRELYEDSKTGIVITDVVKYCKDLEDSELGKEKLLEVLSFFRDF